MVNGEVSAHEKLSGLVVDANTEKSFFVGGFWLPLRHDVGLLAVEHDQSKLAVSPAKRARSAPIRRGAGGGAGRKGRCAGDKRRPHEIGCGQASLSQARLPAGLSADAEELSGFSTVKGQFNGA